MTEPNLHPRIDEPYDASDERQVQKRKLEEARREKDSREALFQLLSAPAGRNWMWSILASCEVFSTTYRPGQPDATTYNEGRRSVGLEITASIMRVDPELYVKMLKEQGKA